MNFLKYILVLLFLGACEIQQKWDYPFPIIGFALDGFPITEDLIDEIKKETQIDPSIIVFYLSWPSTKDFDIPLKSTLDAIWKNKSVPCMTWEPMTIVNDKETTIAYQDILNGLYDGYLEWMASEIKRWGNPLIIRFAQEMNISRYHWGTSLNDYGSSSAKIYVSVFQYIVTYFRNKQINNVLWAFCPNVESVPNEHWNAVQAYYPGDEYVDILGMDGYNWNIDDKLAKAKGLNWIKPWQSFKEIFESLYHQLKQIAPKKPMIVFETASVDRSNNQNKMIWLKDALRVAKEWDIQGIIWFQVSKEEDWKIRQEKNGLSDIQQLSFHDWLLKNFNDFR